VEKATVDAWGRTESDYRPSRWGGFREDYRFTGKEEDVEVGLTYFGARYYSAYLGRWMSPDPLRTHAGGSDANPFAYVRGQLGRAVDPWGLDCRSVDKSTANPGTAIEMFECNSRADERMEDSQGSRQPAINYSGAARIVLENQWDVSRVLAIH
jgi:RHS repeat-associated protein